jgi:hypothetical protein
MSVVHNVLVWVFEHSCSLSETEKKLSACIFSNDRNIADRNIAARCPIALSNKGQPYLHAQKLIVQSV